MPPAIAYDLTRLCCAPPTPSPRGIDRVDVAYARHFFESWRGDSFAILPMPWGTRCFDREFGLKAIEWANRRWRENLTPERDPAFLSAKAQIIAGARHGTSLELPRPARVTAAGVFGKIAHLFWELGLPIGRSAARAIPNGAIYVNAGQVGLAVDRLLSWLDERRDVKSVFMIHDTIPIDHTEFVTRSGSKFHHAMLANSARYASGLIVTTQTAQKSILSALDQAGRKEIRTIAVPLPVAPEFLETERETDAELGAVPYFVFCGAIEPRKNLLLLLNVWRELATRLGLETPKLVIVGARGAAEGETVAMLERCAAIRNYIVEAPGLSSLSLRRLIAGARALLMPSFAEGFGLPIIEALSVGTPVIASDTPAHREVGGHYPTYLSPIDGLGWLEAVCKHAGRDFANRGGSTSYVPFTWNAYFERIDPFIASVATPDRTRQAV